MVIFIFIKFHKIFHFFSLCIEASIVSEMNLQIDHVANEIDIRCESLISEIRKFHDNYLLRLKKYKVKFEKLESYYLLLIKFT
jgi:hypothetical protein